MTAERFDCHYHQTQCTTTSKFLKSLHFYLDLEIRIIRYEQYPYELTKKVNESHFISQSWNSYLNITEMNDGKLGYQEFPNIVTCTRDPLKPTRTGSSMA